MPEQPAFDVKQETAAFAGEATELFVTSATGGDDAVAGHDDWIGIGAASLADSARGVFEVLGHFAIGVGLPSRDGRNLFPDAALEGGTGRAQRQAKGKTRVTSILSARCV